jgi:replicative DNA helicase
VKVLKEIDQDNEGVTLQPSGDESYDDSLLASLGGSAGVGDIASAMGSIGGYDANLAKLAEYHNQRRMIRLLSTLLDKAQGVSGGKNARSLVDEAVNKLSSLMGTGQGASTIGDCAAEVLADHDRAAITGVVKTARWGIDKLDQACPMDMGQIIILAARPGCGKTSLMLQVADATNQHLGAESVAIVTLEMPGKELSRIMIGRQIGVGRNAIRGGFMTEEQRQKFENAVQFWRANDVPIKDQGDRCNVDDVCAWVRSRHRRSRGRLSLVCIDYLQLIQGKNPKHSENDRISEISRQLKILTNQLGISILLLCQLNRESVKDKRDPDLTDLRGSGTIEQDADSVVILFGKDEESGVAQITAKVAKNRYGAKSSTGLEFLRAYGQSFREIGGERKPNAKMFNEPKQTEDVLA